VSNEVLRERTLSVQVISEKEFTNNLARDSLEEWDELTEGAASVAWDDGWSKLGIKGVVLIYVPELFRVLKVPYPYVAVFCELRSGAAELAVLVAIPLYVSFDPLTDLRHQGTNIFHRQLSHRCLVLSCFLLRQLSHLL
jgi:hypothetical protein